MTYCVGLLVDTGLVMLSDSRTNAGVDHISIFSKMYVFEVPGERVMTMLTAGNLAVSQAVANLLNEGIEIDGTVETPATAKSMFRAAQLVGEAVRQVYRVDGPAMQAQNVGFDVSILLGGQLKGRALRLFQIYSAGNFIEAPDETPYVQIGERKYGKPILDRTVSTKTPLSCWNPTPAPNPPVRKLLLALVVQPVLLTGSAQTVVPPSCAHIAEGPAVI